jgi:hypothetical protein
MNEIENNQEIASLAEQLADLLVEDCATKLTARWQVFREALTSRMDLHVEKFDLGILDGQARKRERAEPNPDPVPRGERSGEAL